MENFLQQLINGLTLGPIYGLIAIGYTMVFGIIGMVNFAHGDVFMVATFIALIIFLAITSLFSIPSIYVALLIIMLASMLQAGIGLRTAVLSRWVSFVGFAFGLVLLLVITDFAWIALLLPS